MWNKINMVLNYTGISRRWNSPVFALPHLPFLFCNCFLSLGLYLVIVGFGCLVREMRLWEKRSLKTKKKNKVLNRQDGLFCVCDISQLSRPSFTGQSWSKPMPSWRPLCFSLGIGVFQASQCNPTKIPTSRKEEDFEGQNLGSASNSGTLVHFNICSSKSCGSISFFFVSMCSVPHCRIRFLTFPQYLKSNFDATLLR